MDVLLRPGEYVFTTGEAPRPVMTFTEDEGPTLIVDRETADAHGLPYDLVLSWITIEAVTALDDVGITAAISTALAAAGVSCNMVAALHHDHVFVPSADAAKAVTLIRALPG